MGAVTASTPDRPSPRSRPPRGAAESLGSIVLVFESVIVFLGGLVVYGLQATPPGVEPWWGIVGGVVLAALMFTTARLLRHRWAIIVGWVLQGLVLLGALLVPALGIVGLIFGSMWGYATIKGASLDRRNARLAAETETANGD